MLINRIQLLEVVAIGRGARGTVRIRPRIGEIVHAGVLRTAVGGLVVQAEGVRDFLAHYVLSLVGVVVGGCIEIRVVHLGGTLGDMGAAGNVDRRQSEPTVISVAAIAHLRSSGNHRAALVSTAGDDRRYQWRIAGIPVAG